MDRRSARGGGMQKGTKCLSGTGGLGGPCSQKSLSRAQTDAAGFVLHAFGVQFPAKVPLAMEWRLWRQE